MQKLISGLLVLLLVQSLTACGPLEPTEPTLYEIENPTAHNSQFPFLYTDNTGQLLMSWLESDSTENTDILKFSRYSEDGWSTPETITKSKHWFVNWADFPSIIAHGGNPMASHQLGKIPGNTYSYNVNLSLHSSQGWSDPITPHFDSTATEHGFLSMTPIDNQRLLAIWLDGRRTESRTDAEYFDLGKAMTLRSAIIDTSGTVTQKELIDDSVCDCCSTSLIMTDQGPVASYRNRTDEEIRDIYVSRYREGQWSTPVAVYQDEWKIGACPVNGPKLSAKDSTLAIAWYTAAGENPVVKVAHSSDYGNTFSEPISINSGSTSGRVDLAVTDASTAYLSEINKKEGESYLTVHRISLDTGEYTSFNVSKIDGSRNNGFPQLEVHEGELIFAWTEVAEGSTTSSVRTVRLSNL